MPQHLHKLSRFTRYLDTVEYLLFRIALLIVFIVWLLSKVGHEIRELRLQAQPRQSSGNHLASPNFHSK